MSEQPAGPNRIREPYSIKESGDRSCGFVGYIVVGPRIDNDGSDMEHGVAVKHCRGLNAAYREGILDADRSALELASDIRRRARERDMLLEACRKVEGAFAYANGNAPEWYISVRAAILMTEGGAS